MAVSADTIIGDVLIKGSPGMRSAPRTEVSLVAAVTLGAISKIATAWKPILALSKHSLEITGVFCHAAPQVQFRGLGATSHRCELADLLIVVDQFDQGAIHRRATLVQAKMASKAKVAGLSGVSSIRQLFLYQNWPSFSFTDSAYGINSYSLASTTEQSGSFGIIDRHFKNNAKDPPVWTQHTATPTPDKVTCEPTLGRFVANMTIPTGFGRHANLGSKDEWSSVVDLLMQITYNKVLKDTASLGATSPPRGVTSAAYFLAKVSQAGGRQVPGGWQPPFDGFQTIEDPAGGGVSLLHLKLASTEE